MRTVISGLGMASTLGGVIAAAAAVRAGITRPAPLDYAPLPAEGIDPAAVTGHAVRGLTDGYYFIGRWIRLAQAALEDLRVYSALPGPDDRRFWSRTGLVAAVPDDIEDRFLASDPVDDEYLLTRYLGRLGEFVDWPIPRANLQIARNGNAGALLAVRFGLESLARGAVDRVVVLAVDSLVEPTTLAWLNRRHRLKDPDHPAGLMPGEAGACFVLESERAARERQGRVEAVLASVCVDERRSPDAESGRGTAGALARAVEDALRAAGPAPFDGDFICDLNGEVQRAADFGTMLVALTPRVVGAGVHIRMPAAQLGETGAASAAVGVCLAVRSLARGYALRPTVLVASLADGAGAAACLGRCEPAPGGA